MIDELKRDLTTLEYLILGLLGTAPQTGYGLITSLEQGVSRWSGSPGAVYPALKRLEKRDIIAGEIEAVHEMRPRKVYRLTSLGESLLDEWLRLPITNTGLLDERELNFVRFLFAEKRLSQTEILNWLDAYDAAIQTYDATHRTWYDLQMSMTSVHHQLLLESTMMELEMLRKWVNAARERLQAVYNGSTSQPEALPNGTN